MANKKPAPSKAATKKKAAPAKKAVTKKAPVKKAPAKKAASKKALAKKAPAKKVAPKKAAVKKAPAKKAAPKKEPVETTPAAPPSAALESPLLEVAAALENTTEQTLWQMLALLCLKSLKTGNPLKDATNLDFSDEDKFRQYVEGEEERFGDMELQQGAYAALSHAANLFATAHNTAAAVVVTPEDGDDAQDVAASLAILSAAVDASNNLTTTLSVLDAVISAYSG